MQAKENSKLRLEKKWLTSLGFQLMSSTKRVYLMHTAIMSHDTQRVQQMMALLSVRPNCQKIAEEALFSAACTGFVPIGEVLLPYVKGNLNPKNPAGESALSAAVERGNFEFASFLLEKGADGGVPDRDKMTLLQRALMMNKDELSSAQEKSWREFLKKYVLQYASKIEVNILGANGLTPIVLAVRKGLPEIVQVLLDKGAHPNAWGDDDENEMHDQAPLVWACRLGDAQSAQILLNAGADRSNPDLLDGALYGQSEELVGILFKHGFTSQPVHIHQAVKREAIDTVEYLLGTHVSPNGYDHKGWSPLHYAAEIGEPQMIDVLIKGGAEINQKSRGSDEGSETKGKIKGQTPLILAAKTGNVFAINALLDQGADPFLADETGKTALHYSAWEGHYRATELLLAAAVNKSMEWASLRDKEGNCALLIAAQAGKRDIMQLLIGAGFYVNTSNNRGETPLMVATDRDQVQAMRLLLMLGASMEPSDIQGNTALHVAAWVGRKDPLLLLKKYQKKNPLKPPIDSLYLENEKRTETDKTVEYSTATQEPLLNRLYERLNVTGISVEVREMLDRIPHVLRNEDLAQARLIHSNLMGLETESPCGQEPTPKKLVQWLKGLDQLEGLFGPILEEEGAASKRKKKI